MVHRSVGAYQVSHPESSDGWNTIEVIVPLNYFNGSMRFKMKYKFFDSPYSNATMGVSTSTHWDQYLRGGKEDPEPSRIDAYFDERIVKNMILAMAYFHFVGKFLDHKKEHPPSFDEFRTAEKAYSVGADGFFTKYRQAVNETWLKKMFG